MATYTKEEWMAKGKKLFGDDMMQWEFKCPSCGNVQTPADFEQLKDKGATPNSAYQQCMGRFTGGKEGPHKCDWCAYGLFGGPDVIDGVKAFPFNEEPNPNRCPHCKSIDTECRSDGCACKSCGSWWDKDMDGNPIAVEVHAGSPKN